MAFVNPATAVIVGAVDSHHLLGLYRAGLLGVNFDTASFLTAGFW